jgi:hypothetical protein
MVRSVWLRRAGPGVVAVAAVGMLTSTALGARDRPWAPPDCGPGVRHEAAGRVGQSSTLGGSGDAPWFRLDPILDGAGALAGQRLDLGRADGTGGRTLVLAAESFASGPFGPVVLVGTDDGFGSQLLAIDVLAGCATVIDASADVIRRATIDPDGQTVVEFRLDRRSRSDLGVWRKPLDGDGPAQRFVPPIDPDTRFGRTWSTEFLWSMGEPVLAIRSCGEAACRTLVVDPDTGVWSLVDEPDLGTALGLADGRLVSFLACRGLPCPVVSIDILTGSRQTLAPAAGPAVVIEADDGPRLVYERDAAHGADLRSVRLDGTGSLDLGAVPPGLSLQMDPSRSAAGLDTPAGWVLLAPQGRLDLANPDPGTATTILRHGSDGRSAAIDEEIR